MQLLFTFHFLYACQKVLYCVKNVLHISTKLSECNSNEHLFFALHLTVQPLNVNTVIISELLKQFVSKLIQTSRISFSLSLINSLICFCLCSQSQAVSDGGKHELSTCTLLNLSQSYNLSMSVHENT